MKLRMIVTEGQLFETLYETLTTKEILFALAEYNESLICGAMKGFDGHGLTQPVTELNAMFQATADMLRKAGEEISKKIEKMEEKSECP